MKVLYIGNNEKKNARNDLNKIEARFVERKQKMTEFENKATKMLKYVIYEYCCCNYFYFYVYFYY